MISHFRKILLASVFTLTCAYSPLIASTGESIESASSSATQMRPDYAALESAFPDFFRGFAKTDWALIERYRGEKGVHLPNPELRPLFEELHRTIATLDNPALVRLHKDVMDCLTDPSKMTIARYVMCLLPMAHVQSEYTPEEANFFKVSGFMRSYSLLREIKADDDLLRITDLLNQYKHEPGDFYRSKTHFFSDPKEEIKRKVEAGPFQSVLYTMLCTQPGEDVFGLYYLALTYYKGIHPVPVTIVQDHEKLHGIPMSPWGKLCHDLAHDALDTSDHNVVQFAYNILNQQRDYLDTHFDALSAQEVRKFAIPTVLPHVVNFAMGVHGAYRQSLADLLEASLGYYGVTPSASALDEGFKAFAAGAFIHAHENAGADLMDEDYKLPSFVEQLRSTTIGDEDEGDATQEGSLIFLPRDNLFETSYVTGESPLSDAEIFERVKTQPMSAFRNVQGFAYFGPMNKPIPEKHIVSHEVERNSYAITVKITLYTGETYQFTQATRQTSTLNFEHDLSLLMPAASKLKARFGYDMPMIPQYGAFSQESDPESAYTQAAIACGASLVKGRDLLLRYFYEESVKIADITGIARRFDAQWQSLFSALEPHMPEGFAMSLKKLSNDLYSSSEISEISEHSDFSDEETFPVSSGASSSHS